MNCWKIMLIFLSGLTVGVIGTHLTPLNGGLLAGVVSSPFYFFWGFNERRKACKNDAEC